MLIRLSCCSAWGGAVWQHGTWRALRGRSLRQCYLYSCVGRGVRAVLLPAASAIPWRQCDAAAVQRGVCGPSQR